MCAIRIETDPAYSWVENKNGIHDITALSIWRTTLNDSNPSKVYIEAEGKRGQLLKGGLCLTLDEFRALAKAYPILEENLAISCTVKPNGEVIRQKIE